MDPTRALIVSGILLLTLAALLGFVQERHRASPEKFAAWRVVHAGGVAGAVQLLALAAVWNAITSGHDWTAVLAWALITVAWAFFIGPLARALGRPRLASRVNSAGAVVALPAYVALPVILFL
jgi:hypothetical protein